MKSTTTVTMANKKKKNSARPTAELTLSAKAPTDDSRNDEDSLASGHHDNKDLSTSNGNGHSNGHSSKGHSSNGRKSNNHTTTSSDNSINPAEDSDSDTSSNNETIVVKSQSPPWKKTFDYLADQAFNVAGFAYLSAIGGMGWYFMRVSNIDFWYELTSGIKLMLFHQSGLPFFGTLVAMIILRTLINKYAYPIVLREIYEGKNHKYTAYYCEWLFDAIKNTILFSIGACVAYGSYWYPAPTWGRLGWYPPQGGTIFDANGEIVPTCAVALETIGHFEVTIDFIALVILIYDSVTEHYEAKAALLRHGKDDKQATTTTSFAEDFVHHTGIVFGALFAYIIAKDNANTIAIMVLLGQFNDMCEFAALVLGLCKNWFLERVVTPILCVFWTISLFYVWPAVLIPIFMEAVPIEHNFDPMLVLQLSLFQLGCLAIAMLFWAMHMFWLYKGLLFLYRYNRGVFFAEKKLKFKKDAEAKEAKAARAASLEYGRTSCLATGTMLKPTKEE